MKRDPILYCGLALAFIFGWSVIVPPSRAISTITVTTTNDMIASDGLCSLREAIIAANTHSAFSDCPGSSGGGEFIARYVGVVRRAMGNDRKPDGLLGCRQATGTGYNLEGDGES